MNFKHIHPLPRATDDELPPSIRVPIADFPAKLPDAPVSERTLRGIWRVAKIHPAPSACEVPGTEQKHRSPLAKTSIHGAGDTPRPPDVHAVLICSALALVILLPWMLFVCRHNARTCSNALLLIATALVSHPRTCSNALLLIATASSPGPAPTPCSNALVSLCRPLCAPVPAAQ